MSSGLAQCPGAFSEPGLDLCAPEGWPEGSFWFPQFSFWLNKQEREACPWDRVAPLRPGQWAALLPRPAEKGSEAGEAVAAVGRDPCG